MSPTNKRCRILNDNNDTALMLSINMDNHEIVEHLLNDGGNANLEINGMTILNYTVKNNHHESCELLLKYGANVNKNDPLHLALQEKNRTIIKILLKYKAIVNQKDEYGRAALTHSVISGNYKNFKIILNYDGNINQRDRSGESALFFAVKNKKYKMIEMLIRKGTNVNFQNYDWKRSVLMQAARANQIEIVEYLLKNGTDVKLKDKQGLTALMLSSNLNIIELLLKQRLPKSDINNMLTYIFQNINSYNEPYEIIELLIKYGANVSLCFRYLYRNSQISHIKLKIIRLIACIMIQKTFRGMKARHILRNHRYYKYGGTGYLEAKNEFESIVF